MRNIAEKYIEKISKLLFYLVPVVFITIISLLTAIIYFIFTRF